MHVTDSAVCIYVGWIRGLMMCLLRRNGISGIMMDDGFEDLRCACYEGTELGQYQA